MEAASITLDDVSLDYPIYGSSARSVKNTIIGMLRRSAVTDDETRRVQALKGVTFKINDGDRVGIIGRNGAGKTTLLRVLSGAMCPDRGRVRRVGTTSSLFDVYLGMNSEATGWDNILLRGLFLGLTPTQIQARTEEIATFSGLDHAQLSRPVRTYSSGMSLRLAFAVSTSLNPEIILMDEWIWVGDADFVERAQSRLTDMIHKSRILVIATHADYLIEHLCNKAVYLKDGHVVATGPVKEILALYHAQDSAAQDQGA